MKIYIFPLIFCIALIFAFGIIMVFNTTSAQVLEGSIHIDAYESLYKQIGFGIFSIIIGFIIWHLGYHNVIRLSPAILLLTCILLVLVFIPKIGLTLNGAKRWINVFGFSFQPSELFKYVLPIHFIYYVGSLKKKIDFKSFIKILSLYIIMT